MNLHKQILRFADDYQNTRFLSEHYQAQPQIKTHAPNRERSNKSSKEIQGTL
ncbi:MAG: hypothetical protein QG657_2673 [Acidobacteriota bacterium]|nr:hypothetical protein [Acidobacteriota bacterium]